MSPPSSSSTAATGPAAPSWLGRIILSFSLLLLMHAAYSAFEHISWLKSVNRVQDGLTADIIAQALVAMVLSFFGVAMVADPLHAISLESELGKLEYDAFASRASYHAFGSRAAAFGRFVQ
ncbi:hypothetical protein BC828DRAFT_404966 [Blastocladiella britannica]|nr:hypothetical protein BC828DRAFT_404966 [Blastocladiella britannica]